MEGAANRVTAKANIPSVPDRERRYMNLKFLLGLFFAIAFVVYVAGPLLADSTPNQSSTQSTRNATPLTRIAACLPAGATCDKGSDCCTGNCTPQHHVCGR
jgi:hypothetical protein